MSIVLRSVKGSELTFAEVDGNFESLFYSSSISGNDLNLHFYGGTSQSINLNLVPSLSASYAATASFVQNAQSASYVLNAISSSFASTIANGLNITASNILVTGTASIVFSQIITSSTAFTSGSNLLGANSSDKQTLWGTIDLKSGPLLISGSTTALSSITAPSFTGSLQGTSSWANNAITSSYILNAVSSSYSATASYVQNAITASFALNSPASTFSSSSLSSSYASSSTSASYATNALSASYALTASFASNALSASNARTASYVLNAVSSSFSTFAQNTFLASTASYTLYTSLADAAIYAQNALFATSSLSASFASSSISASYSTNALSASYASSSTSASYATNALSASYSPNSTNALTAVSSSYSTYAENANTANSATTADSATIASAATSATSASYALTASYVENVVSSSFAQNAVTASYILNAVSASFASNSISSSFAQSALTASFALSVIGGTFPFTGSAIISGSLRNIGNTILSGSTIVQSSSLTVSTGSLIVRLPYDGVDNTTNAVIIDRGNNLQPALSVTGSSDFDGALNVNLGTLTAKDNFIASGSSIFTNGGVTVKSGITITGPTLITGSTSITGSTTIVGNTTITGSLRVSGSITGSLLGTASFSQNAISASNIVGAISNNTNDYILTATGGGSINGESGLTFDGGALINTNSGNAGIIKILDTVNNTTPTQGITSFVTYSKLPSSIGQYYGETISGIAANNLSAGKIIYLTLSSDTWDEADNTGTLERKALLGICLNSAGANDPITILLQGFVVTDQISVTSFISGQPLWLGTTGNAMDVAPGAGSRRLIGHYHNDLGAGYYSIRFNPDNYWN